VENFESMVFPDGWTTDDGIVGNGHSNVSFVLFDNLWSADQNFEAVTPALGIIEPDDSLTFDYRFVDFTGGGTNATELGEGDSLIVQISIDCGENYTTELVIDMGNHITSNVMANQTIYLGDYAGETIKIRFAAAWANGDYYIDLDNINIIRCPASLDLSAEVVNESITDAFDGIASVVTGAGLEPFTYAWSTGDSTKTVTGLTAGTYQVIVTDVAGCSDIIEIVIETLVGVEAIDNITAISLAPNPTNGLSVLNVEFSETVDTRIQVVNMMGQVVFDQVDQNVQEGSYEIDLHAYSDGLYFVRILVKDQVHTEKLIRIGSY